MKKYETPVIEIVYLCYSEIITTSVVNDDVIIGSWDENTWTED